MKHGWLRNATLTLFVVFSLHFVIASGIKCYVCSSNDQTHCTETLDADTTDLELSDCSSIYENRFCIKTIGMYKGEVGTSRFCSAVNMGNTCDFIKRKGDVREYRACVYTCSSDGCNGGSVLSTTWISVVVMTLLSFIHILRSFI